MATLVQRLTDLITVIGADIKAKVNKGDLAFNVKDYGAVGNSNASGSTGTDDTQAIKNAVTAAAAAGPKARLIFPAPTSGSAGYRTLDTISIPSSVDVEMNGSIIYAGPAGRPALIIGETGAGANRARSNHRIKVRRGVISDWLSEADLGVRLINQYYANIVIDDASNFTVGAQLVGSAAGSAYNKIYLGSFSDVKIGLDLDAVLSGWVNQNDFFGGSFWSSSLTNANGLGRVAIRITSSDGTYLNNNCNTFHSPSFEQNGSGKTYTSYCLEVLNGGMGNKVRDARCETINPDTVVHTANAARPPYFQASYNDAPLKALEDSTRTGVVIDQESTRIVDAAQRLIFTSGAMHKTAYGVPGGVTVPRIAWGPNSVADGFVRSGDGITIGANYLTLTLGRLIGTFVTTTSVKRFTVVRDAETGFGGRVVVRAYDINGVLLTGTNVVTSPDVGIPFLNNGSWSTGTDTTDPFSFTVSVDVAYIFVAVKSGTNECRIRGFSIYTSVKSGAALPYVPWAEDDFLPNETITLTKPTGGSWPGVPTTRTDIHIIWAGADPSPPPVTVRTLGQPGVLDNMDFRVVY